MSLLLLEAIQEYLTEHHPNWTAITEGQNVVGIYTHKRQKNSLCNMMIHTDRLTMSYSLPSHKIVVDDYTEYTLLQQITNAINHIEQL